MKQLAEKWFGPIPAGEIPLRQLPVEPKQTQKRTLALERDVPVDAIYKTFHAPAKLHPDYYAMDLISDILSRGNSSRLNQRLVKEQKLFSEINAYITGDFDPGLFVITGKPNDGVSFEQAEQAIDQELAFLKNEIMEANELQKVKNKAETTHVYGGMTILSKAMELAFGELLGDADMVNHEMEKYDKVTATDIQRVANEIFDENGSSVLYYKAKK